MNSVDVKHSVNDLKHQAENKASKIKKEAPKLLQKNRNQIEESIQEHPLFSVGCGAAIGLIVGLVIHKK